MQVSRILKHFLHLNPGWRCLNRVLIRKLNWDCSLFRCFLCHSIMETKICLLVVSVPFFLDDKIIHTETKFIYCDSFSFSPDQFSWWMNTWLSSGRMDIFLLPRVHLFIILAANSKRILLTRIVLDLLVSELMVGPSLFFLFQLLWVHFDMLEAWLRSNRKLTAVFDSEPSFIEV